MIESKKLLWLEYIAILIIITAFFIICYCGFFMGDDLYMNYGVSTLLDVFEHSKMFYFTYGGRLFSVASQYLFCGVLGNNRIWFDIVNTLFFALWIMVCGKLISDSKEKFVFCVLLFALLFWFLCPIPCETLFWTAASTTYLWANTLTFIFLWLFQKHKADNFSVVGKLGLFFMSIFAATEFITCASICGAFVVYYAFHIKEFKGNVVPFVIGFAIGSIVLLFAPGNFERLTNETGIDRHLFDLHYLLHNLVPEIIKYKTLWMFLTVFVWGWIKNKVVVKAWVKNNSILLLSLGWSIIAFNLVFSCPWDRALFFTEALSLVLLLRFLFDNYGIIKIRIIDDFLRPYLSVVKSAMMILLFAIFLVDSAFAAVAAKKQSNNNDVLLKKMVDSGGITVLDRMIPSHRMTYTSNFDPGTWYLLADKYGLDSVHVYPHYCLDKYYNQDTPLENVYIDANDNRFKKDVRMIVRVKNDNLQESTNQVVFTIDYYTRPRTWYESLLDKWRNYHYSLTEVVEKKTPNVCFEDYCYYVIWLRRVDAKNLKSVKYEFK